MTILLPLLAVYFAALCVWLIVRIVNRRERWAKWTLATAVGLFVLYVASFGPVVALGDRGLWPEWLHPAVYLFHYPLRWLVDYGPESVSNAIQWSTDLWAA